MSEFVATLAATIECNHSGVATLVTAGQTKAKSDSQLILTDVDGAVISGCTQTGGGQTPCTVIVSLVGSSTKATAGGTAVILEGDIGTTNGVPVNVLTVSDAGQTKAKAT